MAIPNPNPNIFDGAPRDNKTYSSAMIEKKISEGGSSVVPDPEAADIGKVLGVVSDGASGAEYGAVSIPNEVPAPAVGDIGKVLGVVSDGASGAEYEAVSMPSSDIVFIELSGASPEDIQSLPEGVTGEYIYNLVHAGKRVILVCGTDSGGGYGRFQIPVCRVQKRSNMYYAMAYLTIPTFVGNPVDSDFRGIECYSIVITDSNVLAYWGDFEFPT